MVRPDTENELLMKIPGEKPVILLVLLSIITLLFYPFFWYLERSSELNNLRTRTKMGKALPILLILTFVIILGLISGGLIYMIVKDNLPTEIISLSELPNTIQIMIYAVAALIAINLLLQIISAFKARKILNEAIINKGENLKVSWFFTLIFNFLYLQYEINRIVNDKEETKRKAPWIMVIIILVLTAAASYLVYYLQNNNWVF